MKAIDILDEDLKKLFTTGDETKKELLPLASTRLTNALNGGLGKGRFSMIFGSTSSGKTALVLQSIAMWQKMGKTVAFFDVEKTWDAEWAEKLGVNPAEVILSQEVSVDKIINKGNILLEAGVDVLVIDSISMIMPSAFIDTDSSMKNSEDTNQIGARAKAITKMCNSFAYTNENTCIIMISQMTTDIHPTYTQLVHTGGKKAEYVCSQIVKLTSSNTDAQQIKGIVYVNDLAIEKKMGRKVSFNVTKNKLGPQSGSGDYDFYYDGERLGVDSIGEILDDAVAYNYITKGKAGMYYYKEEKWKGRPNAIQALQNNDKLLNEIRDLIENH